MYIVLRSDVDKIYLCDRRRICQLKGEKRILLEETLAKHSEALNKNRTCVTEATRSVIVFASTSTPIHTSTCNQLEVFFTQAPNRSSETSEKQSKNLTHFGVLDHMCTEHVPRRQILGNRMVHYLVIFCQEYCEM